MLVLIAILLTFTNIGIACLMLMMAAIVGKLNDIKNDDINS